MKDQEITICKEDLLTVKLFMDSLNSFFALDTVKNSAWEKWSESYSIVYDALNGPGKRLK